MQYEYPSTRHSYVGYPYRVWIFSILIATALEVLFAPPGYSEFYPQVSFIGFFISVFQLMLILTPAMIFYMLFFWVLCSSKLPNFSIKLLLALIGIILLAVEPLVVPRVFSHSLGSSALSIVTDAHFILFSSTFLLLSLALSLKGK